MADWGQMAERVGGNAGRIVGAEQVADTTEGG